MIKRITYYLMQCERCQEFLREQDGVNADGFSSVDDAEKAAKEAGCNDFIAKPIADDKLKAMIHKWLLPS